MPTDPTGTLIAESSVAPSVDLSALPTLFDGPAPDLQRLAEILGARNFALRAWLDPQRLELETAQ